MQNIHGKEIDLLRTTVKVPGKRLPRATPATAPGTSPRANGLALERSNTQLGGGTGEEVAPGWGWECWGRGPRKVGVSAWVLRAPNVLGPNITLQDHLSQTRWPKCCPPRVHRGQ